MDPRYDMGDYYNEEIVALESLFSGKCSYREFSKCSKSLTAI